MTALDELAGTTAPEPKRDRYNRYLLPDPETGKSTAYTRATTVAGSIKDTFALTKWQLRMAATGLAQRPDLVAQVASVLDPASKDGKATLDKACEAAKEHAGASAKATIGTAVHAFAEQVFAGARQPADVPDPYRADVEALTAALDAAGLEVVEQEQIVALHGQRIAGKFDAIVADRNGQQFVLDIKTGSVDYGMADFAPQLAIYAHADQLWDIQADEYRPMPSVDRNTAVIAHVPAGQGECTLYRLDIGAGWETVQLCLDVRAWRKRKDLANTWTPKSKKSGSTKKSTPGHEEHENHAWESETSKKSSDDPVHISQAIAETPLARTVWIKIRLRALSVDGTAKAWIAAHWPDGTPAQPPWTDTQIDAVADMLSEAEAQAGAPFHNGDPAKAPTPKPPLSKTGKPTFIPPERDLDDGGRLDDLTPLIEVAVGLDERQRHKCQLWQTEAESSRRPFTAVADGTTTVRVAEIIRAAAACARAFVDEPDPKDRLTRAALAHVIGEPIQPAWRTGAVMGSLTIDEARDLQRLADLFAANDSETAKQLGALVGAA